MGSQPEVRKKSIVEIEFEKISPNELNKVVRLEPRKYSNVQSNERLQQLQSTSTTTSSNQRPSKRLSVAVLSAASTNESGRPVDYLGRGFWCSPKGYRKFAWILCVIQAVSMTLWLISILLVKYYWPASHLTGTFLPGYLIKSSGRSRIIMFACLGSQPILSFILLAICLLLANVQIRWIRIFYVLDTWLSIFLIVTGVHIIIFVANISDVVNVRKSLLDELKRYDDNSTMQGILKLSDTKVDLYSKVDWDELQYFFKCCGIDSVKDWYNIRNFFDREDIEADPTYFKVPASCCQSVSSSEIRKCTRYPEENPNMIWQPPRGCANYFQSLLERLSALAAFQVFMNWIIQGFTIIVMRSYYAVSRYGDGSGYKASILTFLGELFCSCLIRKRYFRRTANSEWLMPVNEVLERSN